MCSLREDRTIYCCANHSSTENPKEIQSNPMSTNEYPFGALMAHVSVFVRCVLCECCEMRVFVVKSAREGAVKIMF